MVSPTDVFKPQQIIILILLHVLRYIHVWLNKYPGSNTPTMTKARVQFLCTLNAEDGQSYATFIINYIVIFETPCRRSSPSYLQMLVLPNDDKKVIP